MFYYIQKLIGHLVLDIKTRMKNLMRKKVWYTGVTRAKDSLHLLSTDYKYNYPIGQDYLVYVQGENDNKFFSI